MQYSSNSSFSVFDGYLYVDTYFWGVVVVCHARRCYNLITKIDLCTIHHIKILEILFENGFGLILICDHSSFSEKIIAFASIFSQKCVHDFCCDRHQLATRLFVLANKTRSNLRIIVFEYWINCETWVKECFLLFSCIIWHRCKNFNIDLFLFLATISIIICFLGHWFVQYVI